MYSPIQLKNDPITKNTGEEIEKLKQLEEGMRFLERYIEKEKVQKFKESETWEGAVEDLSLFQFYKNILKDIKELRKQVFQNHGKTEKANDVDNKKECQANEKNEAIKEILQSDLLNRESSTTSNTDPQPSSSNEKTPIKIISNILIQSHSKEKTPVKTDQSIIPSPFKRALTWPEPLPARKKRVAREKIPSVATSKQWQDYHEMKDKKKREEEEKKIKRAEERQLKKDMQNKLKEEKKANTGNKRTIKKQKPSRKHKDSSTDSSETSETWEPSESSDEMPDMEESFATTVDCEMDRFKENDYILVEFPGKKRVHHYVCVIQKLFSNNEAEVVGLRKCEESDFFKLNEEDVSTISLTQVVKKLIFPHMVVSGHRLKYRFKEDFCVDG